MPRIIKPKPLSDIELVILGTAAGRTDHTAWPWPKSLKAKAEACEVAAKALLKRGLLIEAPVPRKSAAWRTGAEGKAIAITISEAGIAALEPINSKPAKPIVKSKATTKTAAILSLLQEDGGTTLAAIMTATGWQAHSIRGFLSGTVTKKLGHKVRSEKIKDQERRYHVEA